MNQRTSSLYIFKCIIIFSLLTLSLNAQNYLWPTNASKHLSSSFCEYRPGHYHSAIDIKTWNREGYPIYAVEDGQIVRIRVSPFGYGKVLYLRLFDGRIAVYAHLQKFNKRLEQAVHKMQIKKERYSIQWYPKSWPVRKGDILGYTGQTGIGVPHLHFEIRDSKDHPLQPLAFYPDYKDAVRPTLQSLLIIPQNGASRVNASYLPQAISLTKLKNGVYKLKKPVRAHGVIGLAIRGFDRSNSVSNKLAFYQRKLFINDTLRFVSRYDTLDFGRTNQIDVEVYYPRRRMTGQRYNKMYIDPFNSLPFYNSSPSDGLIKIGGKPLRFRIEISDYRGNTSIVGGMIIPDDSSLSGSALEVISASEQTAYLQLRLPKDVTDMRFFTQNDSAGWQRVNSFELLGRSSEKSSEHMLIKIHLNSPRDHLLRLDIANAQEQSFYALLNKRFKPKIKMNLLPQEKYMVARFQPFFGEAQNSIHISTATMDTILTPLVHDGTAELALCPRWFRTDSLHIALLNDARVYFDTTLTFILFEPKRIVRKRLAPFVVLETDKKTLFDTVLVHFKSKPFEVESKAPLFSPIFNISSAGPVFNKSALLTVLYDSITVPFRQVALFSINKKGKLSLAGGKADSLKGWVQTRIHSMGNYVVAADTVPPELEILYPKNNATLKQLSYIRFHTLDELSGIGSDANLHISIDGRFVIPEWDPERDIVNGYPHWRLKKGTHLLRVWVKDAVGNRSERNIKFVLK